MSKHERTVQFNVLTCHVPIFPAELEILQHMKSLKLKGNEPPPSQPKPKNNNLVSPLSCAFTLAPTFDHYFPFF